MRCTSFAFNIQRHLVSAPKIACSINNENRTNKSDRETWNKLKLAFFASIIHWMTSSDPYISCCITSYGISKVASHVAVCVNYANFGRNIRLNSRMTIIKPESYNLCLDMISLSIRWAWVWMQNFDKILTSSSGFFSLIYFFCETSFTKVHRFLRVQFLCPHWERSEIVGFSSEDCTVITFFFINFHNADNNFAIKKKSWPGSKL